MNKLFAFAVCLLFATGVSHAEERMGVPVYPGAKHDAATSKSLAEMMQGEALCYVTGDPVGKVAEYYRKQKLNAFGDETKEGAMFKKGSVDVTIQSPWMNMKTGAMMKDTLISIVKMK